MRLYQHSARCPVALRAFLDCNPDYWCFIPLLWQDAEEANLIYLRETTNLNMQMNHNAKLSVRHNQQVSDYLDRVPIPPAAYAFPYRQRQQQRLFFERILFLTRHQRPYSTLDLYRFSIVAVRK
jgi:hypothetical protein